MDFLSDFLIQYTLHVCPCYWLIQYFSKQLWPLIVIKLWFSYIFWDRVHTGLEKLKNPNRSSIFSPQKRKLPNRFSVISVTVVCFHSVLFFSFKIQGASSLLAQRLTYQYCFNTCSININIGISIINSNFAPTVQTRHISSTFIFPISGSLSYWRVLKGNNRRSKAIFALLRCAISKLEKATLNDLTSIKYFRL